jgi:hypothetical protein
VDTRHGVQGTLDREADLLAGAIRLVASGGASRTTVGGLQLAEAAMALVRPLADGSGVILEPLWRADESGHDVLVRRADPEAVSE